MHALALRGTWGIGHAVDGIHVGAPCGGSMGGFMAVTRTWGKLAMRSIESMWRGCIEPASAVMQVEGAGTFHVRLTTCVARLRGGKIAGRGQEGTQEHAGGGRGE